MQHVVHETLQQLNKDNRRAEKKVKEGAHLFSFSVIRDFDNQTSQYRENSLFLMFSL